MRIFLVIYVIFSSLLYGGGAFQERLLEKVSEMASGGGYSVYRHAFSALDRAVSYQEGSLSVQPHLARPSFCSAATYVVFMAVVQDLIAERKVRLKDEELYLLDYKEEPDGYGFWGRWNANGPGVAKLVHDLKLGDNFEAYEKAEPGDLMKIFWTEEIGRRERGHLVVYLGQREDEKGQEWVKFWSSNKPSGYGAKEVKKETIKWAIFSRIHHPKRLDRIDRLDSYDEFLGQMLKRDFSRDEVRKACNVK